MKRNKRLKIWDTIVNHVINNKKEYILVTLLFLVGIFLGVMFINNSKETQLTEITNYMQQFIEKLKNTQNFVKNFCKIKPKVVDESRVHDI